MYDPLGHAWRGVQVAHTEPDVIDKLIRGRATAPAGLARLTVNGEEERTSATGEFATLVAIDSGGTKVEIIATDVRGQRAQKRIELRPDQASLRREEIGNYHALVIGNNEYEFLDDLRTARADAQAVSEVDLLIQRITDDAISSGKTQGVMELEPEQDGTSPRPRRILNPFEQDEGFRRIATDPRLLDCIEALIVISGNVNPGMRMTKETMISRNATTFRDLMCRSLPRPLSDGGTVRV